MDPALPLRDHSCDDPRRERLHLPRRYGADPSAPGMPLARRRMVAVLVAFTRAQHRSEAFPAAAPPQVRTLPCIPGPPDEQLESMLGATPHEFELWCALASVLVSFISNVQCISGMWRTRPRSVISGYASSAPRPRPESRPLVWSICMIRVGRVMCRSRCAAGWMAARRRWRGCAVSARWLCRRRTGVNRLQRDVRKREGVPQTGRAAHARNRPRRYQQPRGRPRPARPPRRSRLPIHAHQAHNAPGQGRNSGVHGEPGPTHSCSRAVRLRSACRMSVVPVKRIPSPAPPESAERRATHSCRPCRSRAASWPGC